MGQYMLFKEDRHRVVNVSKVPQLSPFRYPGGKTWLVPTIRLWLESLSFKPDIFLEPFAGGGIISLTVAAEGYAPKVLMVELDDEVAAVWRTILGANAAWLANRIVSFDLSRESAQSVISAKPRSFRAKAFQTILKNRIYHGGILAAGSGILKNGEKGKGIHSRWYPETLQKRILRIASFRRRITFIEGDGLATLKTYMNKPNTAAVIDPPYTAGGKKAGRRLYRFCDVDHEGLFKLTAQAKGEWILTYDDSDEVRAMATNHDLQFKSVAMQNTHLNKMKELIIGRNLSWLS